MKITQKKLSNKHTYIFEEDSLNYLYEDKSGSDDLTLNYADFPEKNSISIEQNEWLRNVGILWGLLGIYQIGIAAINNYSLSGRGFWLVIGIICIIWYAFTKVKYSVFKTAAGNIFIIHDEHHNQIIAEIKSRRKKQLLNWYGEVNLENDLESEINKFKWLVKQNVMSEQEAEEKIAQAEYVYKSEGKDLGNLN